jgi:hypothetical protein
VRKEAKLPLFLQRFERFRPSVLLPLTSSLSFGEKQGIVAKTTRCPKRTLEEINGDLVDADFGPEIISGPVTCPRFATGLVF